MRIIAGNFRGRRLLGPESDTTRPITDRVKQSIFDIVAGLLPDAVVYDVFAGTGSFGLESLSRGASTAVFFERDRSALVRLNRNIDTLDVRQQAVVVTRDVFRILTADEEAAAPAVDAPNGNAPTGNAPTGSSATGSSATGSAPPWPAADVIFFDPPYRFVDDQPDQVRGLLLRLSRRLQPDGLIVFRHDAASHLDVPELRLDDRRTYGSMTLNLLRRPEEPDKIQHM